MRCFTVATDNDIVPGFKVVLGQSERPFVPMGRARLYFNDQLVEQAALTGTQRLLRAEVAFQDGRWMLTPDQSDDTSVLVLFGSRDSEPSATDVLARCNDWVEDGSVFEPVWEAWLLARLEIGQSIGFEKAVYAPGDRGGGNVLRRLFGGTGRGKKTLVYRPLAVFDGVRLKPSQG